MSMLPSTTALVRTPVDRTPPPVYLLTPPKNCNGRDVPCAYLAVVSADSERGFAAIPQKHDEPALAWRCPEHPFAVYVDLPWYLPMGYIWQDPAGERGPNGRVILHDTLLHRESWYGERTHLNTLAGRYAMDVVCARRGVANSTGILNPCVPSDYRTGRLYDAQGVLLPPPSDDELVCVHCLDDGYGHRMQALAYEGRTHTGERAGALEDAAKARSALYSAERVSGEEWRWLRAHRAELREARAYEKESS